MWQTTLISSLYSINEKFVKLTWNTRVQGLIRTNESKKTIDIYIDIYKSPIVLSY